MKNIVLMLWVLSVCSLSVTGQQLQGGSAGPTSEPGPGVDRVKSAMTAARIDAAAFEFSGQVNISVYLNGTNFDSDDFCLYSVVGGQVRGVSRGMWFEPGKEWIHNHMTYSNSAKGDTVRFRLYDKKTDSWYTFKEYVVFSPDMLIADALNPFKLQNLSLSDPTVLSLEASMTIWPNPVRGSATIKYSIPSEQMVEIQVIDVTGRLIDQLNLGRQPAGEHVKTWNTDALKPGVYFLRIQENPSVNQRLVISR